MVILREDLNFGNLLKDVAARDCAFVPRALEEPARRAILAEVLQLPCRRQVDRPPNVSLQYWDAKVDLPAAELQQITELGQQLAWQVRMERGLLKNLADWHPNSAVAQLYQAPDDHIDTHRDFPRDRLLIAVFTLTGYGVFQTLSGKGGEIWREFETGPGSLVLLRAGGLVSGDETRPFHRALTPNQGERVSLTFRMTADALPANAAGRASP